MTLGDWASWAGIVAVPLAIGALLVGLAQVSRQRRVREQLRTIITEIRTELTKATMEIKTGGDLTAVPEVLAQSHERIKPLYEDIRFIPPREIDEMSLAIVQAKGAWDLVTHQMWWCNRNAHRDEQPNADDVRKRARAEDFLVEMIERADREIATMLKKLRRLDSGNVLGAIFTR